MWLVIFISVHTHTFRREVREFLSLDERSNAKKSANSDDSGVETSSGNESGGDGRQATRSSEEDENESDESRPGSAMINITTTTTTNHHLSITQQRSVPIVKGNINLGPSERP